MLRWSVVQSDHMIRLFFGFGGYAVLEPRERLCNILELLLYTKFTQVLPKG